MLENMESDFPQSPRASLSTTCDPCASSNMVQKGPIALMCLDSEILHSADDDMVKKEWTSSPVEMCHEAGAEHMVQSLSSPSSYGQVNSTTANLNYDNRLL
jgi:hypothetical protein